MAQYNCKFTQFTQKMSGGGYIRQVAALSGDELFLEKLERGQFSGEVHSAFRQAINISGTDSILYSIVTEKLDNAPNTLRISLAGQEDATYLGIKPGAAVFMHNGSLVIGTAAIHTAGIKRWRGTLPAFPPEKDLAVLEQNLTALCQVIRLYGQEGGLKAFLGGEAKATFPQVLRDRSHNLLNALAERDFPRALAAGRSLLGLGGGQTPSGDDFCAGLLVVMHLSGSSFDEEFQSFGRCLAGEAKQLTTEISQALLLQAAQGRAREKLVDLLSELMGGSQESTTQSAMQVLKIGSMSGTDLAVGIAAGVTLGLELRIGCKGGRLWP